jgi:hypothetical protein
MVEATGGVLTGEFILPGFSHGRRCSICRQDSDPCRVECFGVESRDIMIPVLEPLYLIIAFEVSVLIEFVLRLFRMTDFIPAANHFKNVFAYFPPSLVSLRTGELW